MTVNVTTVKLTSVVGLSEVIEDGPEGGGQEPGMSEKSCGGDSLTKFYVRSSTVRRGLDTMTPEDISKTHSRVHDTTGHTKLYRIGSSRETGLENNTRESK